MDGPDYYRAWKYPNTTHLPRNVKSTVRRKTKTNTNTKSKQHPPGTGSKTTHTQSLSARRTQPLFPPPHPRTRRDSTILLTLFTDATRPRDPTRRQGDLQRRLRRTLSDVTAAPAGSLLLRARRTNQTARGDRVVLPPLSDRCRRRTVQSCSVPDPHTGCHSSRDSDDNDEVTTSRFAFCCFGRYANETQNLTSWRSARACAVEAERDRLMQCVI